MKQSNLLLLAVINTMSFCFALHNLLGNIQLDYLFLLIFSVGAVTSTFFLGESNANE